MTKKILRISSMTLGLALLLLGNEMNHAKADFKIQWPKGTHYSVYEIFLATSPNPIAEGPASGTSYNKINVIGALPWSSYPQGVMNIKVKTETGNTWQSFASLPMTSWKNTGSNSINDVLNETTLTLNSNGTFTVTYPNR